MRKHLLVLPLAALVAAGCDDSLAPRTPQEVEGFWLGTTPGVAFELVLSEFDDDLIKGTGALRVADGNIALTVTGNNVFPVVAFTLRSRGFEDINFLGEFIGRDVLRGRLNGGGFENVLIRFRRRPFVSTLPVFAAQPDG